MLVSSLMVETNDLTGKTQGSPLKLPATVTQFVSVLVQESS